MRSISRLFIFSGVFIAFLTLFGVFKAIINSGSQCASKLLSKNISKDGLSRVDVYLTNCGATSSFSTQAYLVYGNEKTDLNKDFFFSIEGDEPFVIKWEDAPNEPAQLKIIVQHKAGPIFRKAVTWNMTAIEYIPN